MREPAEARRYVEEARRDGHRDRDIEGKLREAGWTEGEIAGLLAPAAREAEPVPGEPPPVPRETWPDYQPPRPSRTWVWQTLGCLTMLFIVGAILFPVFARARPKACSNNCLSNVKQLMLGQLMYASDNHDQFPPAQDWAWREMPYVKNEQIFACPNETKPRKYGAAPHQLSYTMNLAANEARQSSLAAPAELPVIFDGTEVCGGVGAAAFRHNDGVNVGFADGHAKWIAKKDFTNAFLFPTGLKVTPLRGAGELPPVDTGPPPMMSKAASGSGDDPVERYSRVLGKFPSRPGAPRGNSEAIRVAVRLDMPAAVWAEERFTATAHGSYDLAPELRKLIHEGKATLRERYTWEGAPAVFDKVPAGESPHTPTVTGKYRQEALATPGGMNPGVWVSYLVAVHLADGSYQWARAETHAEPVVQGFHITLVQPVYGPIRSGPDFGMEGLVTHLAYTFHAMAHVAEDENVTKQTEWKWVFDDGTSATGAVARHSYERPGRYQVLVQATYQGRVAKAYIPIGIRRQSGGGNGPAPVESKVPAQVVQEVNARGGYAPPLEGKG